MAQLKDTIITGDLRVTDMIYGKHEGDPHHTYYVKGTQTGTTGAWTGNLPDVDALYEGLTIDYWLPYAGSGNATLNLTLKGGTTTGAINCYLYNTTRLTTHIPQYAICRLVYQTVNINGTNYSGWWIVKAQDNNDVGYNLKFNASKIVASNTIYRYQLLFTIDDDTITPLTSTNNTTGTSKTMLTNVEFDPYLRIYYYSSTTIIDANATVAFSAMYYQYCGFDLRYTLNCGQTLTTDKPFYLKVTLQSNGKAKIASDPCWAQSLPTTNDGYAYIYLGRTYSNYQLMLYPDHPVYAWDGSKYEDTRKIELNNKADTSSLGALAVKDTVDYATEVTNKPSTFTPSSHTHTAEDIVNTGYLNIHPENTPTIIPFMHNDIAYLTKRGGSATVTFDGVSQTVNANIFDASPSYWTINSSNISTVVIELTLHKAFDWGNIVYIDFGLETYRAKSVKIEVMNTNFPNDVWTEKGSTTTNALGHYYVNFRHTPVGASSAGSGFNKIRYTLSSFQTSSTSGFRIAQVGVYNYGSFGLRETFLPKDGGELYGNIQPYSNNGANLGTSSKYFNNAYVTKINGVSVGSSPKFTDTTYTATTDTVGSASAGTAITADDITSWSTGTLPNLGTAIATDDITAWSTGTLPSMTVNGETLIVNFGTLPSLSYTEKSIPNVTSIGTLPSLSYTEKTIPNISVTNKTVVTEILVS